MRMILTLAVVLIQSVAFAAINNPSTGSGSSDPQTIYYADGVTLKKTGSTFSVQPWIPDNLLSLRFEMWNHFEVQERGLLDGPGYWFNDQNGIIVEMSTNANWNNGVLSPTVGYFNATRMFDLARGFYSLESTNIQGSTTQSFPEAPSPAAGLQCPIESIGITTQFTYSALVKTSAFSTSMDCKRQLLCGAAGAPQLGISTNGKLVAHNGAANVSSVATVADGAWHQVTYVFVSGVTNIAWIDGTLAISTTAGGIDSVQNFWSYFEWQGALLGGQGGPFILFNSVPEDLSVCPTILLPTKENETWYYGFDYSFTGEVYDPRRITWADLLGSITYDAGISGTACMFIPMIDYSGKVLTNVVSAYPTNINYNVWPDYAMWRSGTTDVPTNMALVVTNSLLSFVPSSMSVSALVHGDVAQSNVILSASRDLGVTWVYAPTVSVVETWDINNKLVAGVCSFTGSPVDSNVLARIQLTNGCAPVVVKGIAAPCGE